MPAGRRQRRRLQQRRQQSGGPCNAHAPRSPPTPPAPRALVPRRRRTGVGERGAGAQVERPLGWPRVSDQEEAGARRSVAPGMTCSQSPPPRRAASVTMATAAPGLAAHPGVARRWGPGGWQHLPCSQRLLGPARSSRRHSHLPRRPIASRPLKYLPLQSPSARSGSLWKLSHLPDLDS